MSLVRTLILKGSHNPWLRKHAQSFPFVRRAVSRFMPGEHLEDAIAAARTLASQGIITMLTKVGENVTDAGQATAVTDHYLEVVRHIREAGLAADVRHEPDVALFGGTNGLRNVEGVLDAAIAKLPRGGWLVMEFGYGQESDVRRLLAARPPLRLERIRADLQGIPRTAVIERP